MDYTLNKPNGAALPATITVPTGAIDSTFYDFSTNTGVKLVGQNAVDFGTVIAQNTIQMMTNFAGSSAPPASTSLQGQTWFDNVSGQLKVRTDANTGSAVWTPLAVAAGSSVTSFNSRTGAVTLVAGDVTGALGFTPVSSVDVSGGLTGLTFSGGPVTSSGIITMGGILAVANGGTGASSLSGLTNSVLPSQGGHAGEFLTTDGTNPSWAAVSGGGGGTVTSVSALGTQGVTISVTNPTTTPTINIGLAEITPDFITITSGNGCSTNGNWVITNASPSVGTASGALVVTGGIGLGGDIFAGGNITASASDSRLKTNLSKIGDAVSKVQQLTGYTYDWDQQVCKEAGFMFSEMRQVGVIAQDVQVVLPEAVAPAPANHDYLTVRYEKLVALLIEAVKEQAEEIAAIKKLLK